MEENTHEKHDEDHHKESHEEHHGDQNKEHHKETHETHHEEHHEEKPKEPILKRIKRFYINNYKKLLIIPNIILVLAILQIIIHVSMTGDFLNKGVSLKGGISITVPLDQGID
ncbi:MAG: hypothetical protein QF915_00480, partial [Candidatus Woesearchaeota archaeon]|nr:hypothetical protein [Candidatus Woesearchaeota archaeon]